jgi:hypothetical protein
MLNNLEHVFIDEFGDTSLYTEKSAVTNTFILSATLVSDLALAEVEDAVDVLRKKHFQEGELKSSSVGGKDKRRIKILKDISKLNVKFYVVAINKTSLHKNGGLIYKKSFFKFINGIIYRTIFEVFPNTQVVADEHGYPEFMDSFKKYVLKRHRPNLFNKVSFSFGDSKNNPLIQISDFIAGTLARVLDQERVSEHAQIFLDILDEQLIRIDEWPIKPRVYSAKLGIDVDTEFDEKIRQISFNQASNFIEKNSSSNNEQIMDQVGVLQYLLHYFKFIDPYGFVYGNELLSHCRHGKKKHYLHSSIIAKLRDQGVIISSSNKGYKIPANSEDLYTYVEQSHTKILPMLSRLDKANKKIQLATKKDINLLQSERYEYLQIAIDAINGKNKEAKSSFDS